ncbi:GNAT family N-acetyltransferase [Dactylosporangium sp. McL0621]|uniref:GNAT family N-acetyltransferase n=1 Tax=Dactylosporangium sp. McL0621 TaxID=3415678 RepID=UPI003CE9C4E2
MFSDILGHLLEATETHLTIRARTGAVRVPVNEIVRAKPVPPRRRFTPTESLEAAAALGWPAREQARLGDWQLRATDGWTQRANSALAIGSPDLPPSDAIEFVRQWYRERSLTPAMSIPVPLFQRLDNELERLGWTAMPVTQVMTAALPPLLAALSPAPPGGPAALSPAPPGGPIEPAASPAQSSAGERIEPATSPAPSPPGERIEPATSPAPSPPGERIEPATSPAPSPPGGPIEPATSPAQSPAGERIELATSPSDDWLAAVAGRKGPLPESARHVLTAVPEVRFAEWYDEDGTLLGTARGVVADEESRWLGLSLIGVDERMRRRGLAQRLIAALVQWALTLGARDAYLQVEQRNTAAVALYERLGFTVHHVYSSRRLLTG